MEDIKKIFDYMFFRDMGVIGEGCIISFFIWVLVFCLIVLIGKYFLWF